MGPLKYPAVDSILSSLDKFMAGFDKAFRDPTFFEVYKSIMAHHEGATMEELKGNLKDFQRRFDVNAQQEGDRLLVFRCISVEKPEAVMRSLKTKPVGIYWSWDYQGAECHWGDKNHPSVILHALVSPDSLEWLETLATNIQPFGQQENEIRLKAGASIEIVDVEVLTAGEHKTNLLKRPIKVRASLGAIQKGNWLSRMNNKQLGAFWEDMAYGDWGETDPSDGIERINNMYEADTMWSLKTLPVESIEGHHSGHDASEEYIKEYQQTRQKGSPFPPLIVEPDDERPGKYKTIDGQHRLFAAKALGEKDILAYVPDEGPQTATYKTVDSVLSDINTFMEDAKALEDFFDVEVVLDDSSEEGQGVWIDELQAKHPGEGRKFMKQLTELADQEGMKLYLNAHPIGPQPPLNREQLIKWYKGFGFEPEDYQDTDYDYITMRRLPKASHETANSPTTIQRHPDTYWGADAIWSWAGSENPPDHQVTYEFGGSGDRLIGKAFIDGNLIGTAVAHRRGTGLTFDPIQMDPQYKDQGIEERLYEGLLGLTGRPQPTSSRYVEVDKILAADEAEAKLVFQANEKEPFRYVWRMQNADGTGPYDSEFFDKYVDKNGDELYSWMERPHEAPATPSPTLDRGFTREDRRELNDEMKRFGFDSLKELKEWFTPGEIKNLAAEGFKPSQVKALKIWSSGKQNFFFPAMM